MLQRSTWDRDTRGARELSELDLAMGVGLVVADWAESTRVDWVVNVPKTSGCGAESLRTVGYGVVARRDGSVIMQLYGKSTLRNPYVHFEHLDESRG